MPANSRWDLIRRLRVNNSTVFYICVFDIRLPEDDLRSSKHVAVLVDLCGSDCFNTLHLLVLSIQNIIILKCDILVVFLKYYT